MPKYTKEEVWSVFEKLPKELKSAVFSEETANIVWDICQKYPAEIKDKKIPQVAELIGYSLMGFLPPAEFEDSLRKEVGLNITTAQEITQQVIRFILYPLKEHLEPLYEIRFAPGGRIIGSQQKTKTKTEEPSLAEEKREEISQEEISIEKEKPSSQAKPQEEDVYREPIE